MMAEGYDAEKNAMFEKHISGGPSSTQDDGYNRAKWETGVKARFPWIGVESLICVLIAAVAATLVLILCNGGSQSAWPVTPNVILAIINAFVNIMLAVAIGQGVAIAWWRKVLGGATVKNLHHSWAFSTSITSMFKGWRYLNFIALASLAAKLSFIDGIFLQGALQTYNVPEPAQSLAMKAPLVTTWPATGIVSDSVGEVGAVRMDFQNNVVNGWTGGAFKPTISTFEDCNGICQGTFEGIGFAFAADSTSREQVNLTDPKWQKNTSVPVFDVSFEMSWASATKKYSSFFVNMLYFAVYNATGDCTGSLYQSRYEARPALVAIDFRFENFSKLNIGESVPTIELGNTLARPPTSLTPAAWIASVFLALQQYLGLSVNITYNSSTKNWDQRQQGTFQLQQEAAGYAGDIAPGSCNYNFFFGTDGNIISAINNLALKTTTSAWLAGPPQNITASHHNITTNQQNNTINQQSISTNQQAIVASQQSIIVNQQAIGIHYKTNFSFLAVAVAAMVICVFLVLPSYWKFWDLGRTVSLSPVETANAFRAPVLDSLKASNSEVEVLLEEVGDKLVMFGHISEGRLAIEEIGKVREVRTT